MAEKKRVEDDFMDEVADEFAPESIEKETRVDDFAVAAFRDMGYLTTLPDEVVEVYREFKARRDKLMPGRLSPGEFAAVCSIADTRIKMREQKKR